MHRYDEKISPPGVVADGSRLHFGPVETENVQRHRRRGPASAPAAKRYVMPKEMSKRIAPVIAFPMLLLLLGCSEKQSGNAAEAEQSRIGIARIVFDLPGDDIGSQEAQLKLEEIRTAMLTSGVMK